MALNFPANTTQPYIDQTTGLKYVYNNSVGAWESAIQPPAIVYDHPPNIRIPGFLYWDKQEGNLYIFYRDDNGDEQWVEAVPNNNKTGNSIGILPPPNPSPSDLWFDIENGRLYVWYDDGGSSQWVDVTGAGGGGGGASISVSDTPPPFPNVGGLWFNSNDGRLYVWYEDPTSSQWVDVTGVTSLDAGITNLRSPDNSIDIFRTQTDADIRISIGTLPVLP